MAADNASSNDTMMEELEMELPNFSGQATRVRCFLHVTNLVAKTLIKQFDLPKHMAVAMDDEEIPEADDIQFEGDVDNTDGWVDELAELSPRERQELDVHVKPLRNMLVKVSRCAQYDQIVVLTRG